MLNLTDNVKSINGISDKRAALYKKLSIETIGDLLTHYPRGYIDFTAPVAIADVTESEQFLPAGYAVIRATVTKKMAPYLGKIAVYKLMLTDESGAILCTFFNSEYNYTRLILNKEYIFYGKINTNLFQKEIVNPIFITPDDPNKLTPKYRLTKGLSHAIVSANVKTALMADCRFADLPEQIIQSNNLMPVNEAIRKIHFPDSAQDCRHAKRSLVFKELLVLQLGLAMIRSRNRKLTGARMTGYDMRDFYGTLPFKPTNAQMRAVNDCARDMQRQVPMNRLLQGDVGSGKTMVAAALAYYAHLNGFQTALMAPTEILAKQHYKTISDFMQPHAIKVVLIVGGMTAVERRERRAMIQSGEAGVVVGTHALIQKGIEFNALGLVVTDEQHRFGVGQRSELISKGANPHTLVMSATPIPRTLGLIIYGDLDISLLDEMPAGRLPIKTYGVDSSFRERLYRFIIKQVNEGKQAYIVCPLIEEGETPTKTSAVKYYNELQAYFDSLAQVKAGLLHGRMKQSEKDDVMGRFKAGEVKVLISTTVIEVGVDVPNAVVMLIENAEQFGLSQLHQLRGRVGRGSEQSYCILVTDSDSPYTKARVETMSNTNNGFEIAGKDLELRGPGDFFGRKQHGLPLLKIGSPSQGMSPLQGTDMSEDSMVLEETRSLAKNIIKDDPELTGNPQLREMINELFKDTNEYGFN
jgi:ATP-dependent DNA helicase RecG